MTAPVEMPDAEELEPLKLTPHADNPRTLWAVVQTVGAVAAIFAASQLFVREISGVGPLLGLPAQLVALMLSPIATELPETMNAVIWFRQGKSDLSLANISGAMMIQATIPSALGLFFTPWMLDRTLEWAAVVTVASIVGLYRFLKDRHLSARKLAVFGALYIVFAAGVPFLM
jgi:cation:H+ antiporter